MKGVHRRGVIAAVVSTVGLYGTQAWAASAVWKTAGSGNWNTAANWNTGSVPGVADGTFISTDIATFGPTGAPVVTVDTNRNIGGITFATSTNVTNGYNLTSGSLLLTNGGVIQTDATDGGHTSKVTSPLTLEGNGGSATFSSNSVSASNYLIIAGTVAGVSTGTNVTTLNLNGTSTALNSNNIGSAIQGVISDGSGGGKLAIVKSGTGTWTIASAASNTYSGGTIVQAGTLQAQSGTGGLSVLGTGTVTVGDPTAGSTADATFLDLYNNVAINNPIVLGATTGKITIGGGGSGVLAKLAGGITGNNSFTIANAAGNQNLQITGLVNNAGTVTNASLQTSAGGGTYLLGGVGSNVTALIQKSATATFTIQTGAIALRGAGLSTTLQNDSTATTAAILNETGGITGTGNVILNNNSAIANGITVGGTAPTFTGSITNSGTGTGNSLISAGLGLTISGITQNSGTSALTITGNNTAYTGGATISNGTLIIGAANALGSTGTINNSGTLAVNSGVTFARAVTWNSGSSLAGKGTYTPGGTFSVGNNVSIAPGIGDVGTLTIGNATTFTSGSKFAVDLGSGAANTDKLSVSGTATLTGGTAAFNMLSTPDQGVYNILHATTVSGTFAGTSNLPAAYKLVYTSTDVNLQHLATIGTITATPSAPTIITGGSMAFGFTVANSAPSGSFGLSFSTAAGSGTNGTVSGPVAVAAGATSATQSGLTFTGTTVGSNQTGSFTVSDAASSNGSAVGTVQVNVLDHSQASFNSGSEQTTLNVNLGTFDQGSGTHSTAYSIYNLLRNAAGTAGLDLMSFALSTADSSTLSTNLSTFNNLAAGSGNAFNAVLDTTNVGTFNESYTLNVHDLSGLSGGKGETLTLNLTGAVTAVPEPAATAVAIGVMGLMLRRRKLA